ncbi:hypothetical protein G6F62_015776 [Rhizopus arrhizus]|nr:hypothetical protein G6F62_015776 [Rhizopus arrhizus]
MTPWTPAAPAQQLQQHRRRPADPRQHGHAHADSHQAGRHGRPHPRPVHLRLGARQRHGGIHQRQHADHVRHFGHRRQLEHA